MSEIIKQENFKIVRKKAEYFDEMVIVELFYGKQEWRVASSTGKTIEEAQENLIVKLNRQMENSQRFSMAKIKAMLVFQKETLNERSKNKRK